MYALNTNLNCVSGGNNPYQNGNPNNGTDFYINAGGGPNQQTYATAGVTYQPHPDFKIGGSVTVYPNGGSANWNTTVVWTNPKY